MTERMQAEDVTLEEIESAFDWFDFVFDNYRSKMTYLELNKLLNMKRAAREALSRQCFGR
jgi:iron uptake system EfeUOB component EfeO/EfeM